jgi:hypothetical protein
VGRIVCNRRSKTRQRKYSDVCFRVVIRIPLALTENNVLFKNIHFGCVMGVAE